AVSPIAVDARLPEAHVKWSVLTYEFPCYCWRDADVNGEAMRDRGRWRRVIDRCVCRKAWDHRDGCDSQERDYRGQDFPHVSSGRLRIIGRMGCANLLSPPAHRRGL